MGMITTVDFDWYKPYEEGAEFHLTGDQYGDGYKFWPANWDPAGYRPGKVRVTFYTEFTTSLSFSVQNDWENSIGRYPDPGDNAPEEDYLETYAEDTEHVIDIELVRWFDVWAEEELDIMNMIIFDPDEIGSTYIRNIEFIEAAAPVSEFWTRYIRSTETLPVE